MKNYNTPYIDRLLRYFDRGYGNPSSPSQKLCAAIEPLFEALSNLAPIKNNDEVKSIWITAPRGGLDAYGTFEELQEYEEIASYEEYIERWQEDYPDEIVWYKLTIVEVRNRNGNVTYRGIILNDKTVVSADMEKTAGYETWKDDAIAELCTLLTYAAERSMDILRKGKYNSYVESCLPHKFRTGVIKRDIEWAAFPEMKASIFRTKS